MTLKVGDLISYSAGKASGKILAINNNGRHSMYRLSNGDELVDLDKQVGRPGGVRVIAEAASPQADPPLDIVKEGLEVIVDEGQESEETEAEILDQATAVQTINDPKAEIATLVTTGKRHVKRSPSIIASLTAEEALAEAEDKSYEPVQEEMTNDSKD